MCVVARASESAASPGADVADPASVVDAGPTDAVGSAAIALGDCEVPARGVRFGVRFGVADDSTTPAGFFDGVARAAGAEADAERAPRLAAVRAMAATMEGCRCGQR